MNMDSRTREEFESMEDILNPPEEVAAAAETSTTSDHTDAEEEQATGETTQVAAETTSAESAADPTQVKAELSALARERARIREKEAALDEGLARLAAGSTATETTQGETATDPRAELKGLRKQHREALLNLQLDPENEEAEQLVDKLEDQMEDLRRSIDNKDRQTMTAQEKSANDFNTVHATVHDEFPFLQVDHPQCDAELNEDINAHYLGRMQKGDSPAVALRKAVDKFAPAYAKGIGAVTQNDGSATKAAAEKSRKEEADKLVREKLGKGGFSEVRSVGRSQADKPFTGPTPMASILGKTT